MSRNACKPTWPSWLLMLAWILIASSVATAREGVAPPSRKHEIKLFVTPAHTEQAIKIFKLDEQRAVKQTVSYFDTSDRALEAQGIILRARKNESGWGESTVKLRDVMGARAWTDEEQSIPAEQDWTQAENPAVSRSVNHDRLTAPAVSKVLMGQSAASTLFNERQQKLVSARMPQFDWTTLRRYGPVEALVWRRKSKLQGFSGKVTVELWRLQREGKSLEILEVSANARVETDEQARVVVQKFFSAAKLSGLGEPVGLTKTKMTLDFFKPGL